MRDWQVGDPIGDGNDIGVPDIRYMGYLKNKDCGEDNSDNSSSDNPITHYEHQMSMARIFKKDKRYEEAIDSYKSALKYKHDDDVALIEMSECYLKLNNARKASMCYYDLGLKYKYKDDIEKAILYLKKAVEINPNYNSALSDLGHTLTKLKRYREAITYFKMANTIGIQDYNWIIAYCYMDLNEYASAVPHWDKAIEHWPSRDDWIEEKLKCLTLTNKKEAAIFYNSYAKSLIENKQYFKGLQCLDKILEIDPYDTEARSQKQNCLKNERYKCLYNILNALSKAEQSISRESDEDLKKFLEDISKKSHMSIEDIFSYCYFLEFEDYDFKDILREYVSDDELIRLHEIYGWSPYGESDDDDEDEENNDEDFTEKHDDWKNLSEELSKTKSLDELEDEYWNLVKEKNSYDVLDEIDIMRDDKKEEPPVDETVDKEEITNVNYLSKIKEAKELLDSGAITQQEYDELKRKFLDLI